MTRKHLLLGLAGALLLAQLLLTSFRLGWTHQETDFPNYYTAAALTLDHQPLRNFYDWTWFQREINYKGTEGQLGGYIPHTPLTMIPLLPVAHLPPQKAKQVWLLFSLACLLASIWMLANLTGLHITEVLLAALLAHGALHGNLIFGQYYLFLLLLLTASAWCLLRGRPFSGGALIGLIFALKLYTALFFLYFMVRRQWRALAGMAVSVAILTAAAVAIFGFDAVWYFANTVMARALDGSSNDPYNAGWGSMTALLRRTLVPEAELNPHPAFVMPGLFFFLQSLYSLGVLAVSLLVLWRGSWDKQRAFGWFVIVLFALSPNPASYHFILLLVPVALFLRGSSIQWSAGLLTLYVLIEMPLPAWRAWLLLALLLYAGWRQLASIPRAPAAAVLIAVLAASSAAAWRRLDVYGRETPQVAEHAVIDPGAIFSSAPALGPGEIVYQAMGRAHYVLRIANGGRIRTFPFEGEALHPAIARTGGSIYFELVAGRHSRICAFDPATQQFRVVVGPELDPIEPALSPDGATLAFVSGGALYAKQRSGVTRVFSSRGIAGPAFYPDGRSIAFADGPPGRRSIRAMSLSGGGARVLTQGSDCIEPAISPDGTRLAYSSSGQLWIQDLASGKSREITSGACDNGSPAWQSDSQSIVFASDCSRGMGLPALYRLTVPSLDSP